MKIINAWKTDAASLTEQVYEKLHRSIITGEIPSGTRLVESALAEEMGVSRTPVRETLHKLALEGLLYSIPRAGYIVEDMSEYDIQDLFATRTAIEQVAGRWAVENITPTELERLEMNLTKTDEIIRSGLTQQMMDLDVEFHQIIYRATRSKRLYQISQTLSDHTLKFRIACIHIPEIAQRARDDHFRIYKALQSKDAEIVDEAVLSHLENVKKDVLGYLERLREESFIAQDGEF